MLAAAQFKTLTKAGDYHILPIYDGSLQHRFECCRCRRTLPDNHFYPLQTFRHIPRSVACDPRVRRGSVSLLHGMCRGCQAQMRGEWVKHRLYSPELDRYWADMAAKNRSNAKVRGIFFGLDKDDLLGIYLKQEGLCALTGLPMNWQAKGTNGRGNRAKSAPSVDRKDSHRDYTADNVQIVLEVVNRMKSDLPQDMFLELCRAVSLKGMAL